MNIGLSIGKSGMMSNQYKMDAIADNIANVATDGYKNKEVDFKELLNNDGINVGSKALASKLDFKQGSFVESPYDYHMAIGGDGFFGIEDENGTLILTRNGGFHMNEDGSISDHNGYSLVIDDIVPREEWPVDGVAIGPNGDITSGNQDGSYLGKVILFYPENLDSLRAIGDGRFLPSDNVGILDSRNNEEGFGQIQQYFLETSNVDLADNFSEMIIAQRAYSLSAKAVQTADEMMTMINGMKR